MYSFGLPGRCYISVATRGNSIAMLKYLNPHLFPHPCFHQQRHFSGKVIICPAPEVAPLIIIPVDEQTVAAPFCARSHSSALLTPQNPPLPPVHSLQLYPHPNRLLRCLLGAWQYKFAFLPAAGPDDTAALCPTD